MTFVRLMHSFELESSMIVDAEHEVEELERPCQAVSPDSPPRGFPATVRCAVCKKWFCDAHAEDDQGHSCGLTRFRLSGLP